VLLIVIDTLRADRLGTGGDHRAHTPNLDALARRGTRFTHAMTPAPVTLPAVASLLTGRTPLRHGVRDNEHFVLPAGETTLAERLRADGWRTAAVVGSAVLAADRGLNQGLESYDDAFAGPYPVYDRAYALLAGELAATRRRADRVTDSALELLGELPDERFFLLVHYFDVHMFHDPPPAWAARCGGDLYRGEVAFVDDQVGRLLAALEGRDDVLIVVTADHGEALGEHGEPQHGFLLYESTLHVPLIVAGPGVEVGAVRDEPVSLVDVEPWLARRCGLADDGGVRDGVALWDDAAAAPRELYAETMMPLTSHGWRELRALRAGRWKLISGPPDELYQVERDRHELRDLAAAMPALVDSLSAELAAIAAGDDAERVLARSRGELDPARRRALESLGYLSAPRLAAVADGERLHPRDGLPEWVALQTAKNLMRRAAAWLDDGDEELALALSLADSALALRPQLAEACFTRARVRRRLGDNDGAGRDLARYDRLRAAELPAYASIEARIGDPRPLAAAELEALGDRCRRLLLEERVGEALPLLRRMARERPDDPTAHYNLGLAAHRAGAVEESHRHLERYLELAPDHANAALVRRLLGQGD
jgi:arylsulfatase A-like enzyme/regulator of sirC expression with transglutaminase-like and TPR domain